MTLFPTYPIPRELLKYPLNPQKPIYYTKKENFPTKNTKKHPHTTKKKLSRFYPLDSFFFVIIPSLLLDGCVITLLIGVLS